MIKLSKNLREYNDIINFYEVKMADCPVSLPLTHKFCNGMYRRELFIPKGGLLSSLVHLEEHFFEVVAGVINVLTPDGLVRYIAPADGVSKKGARKLGYALEDTVFVTIHPNPDNCRDIEVLEARLFKRYNNPLLAIKNEEEIK